MPSPDKKDGIECRLYRRAIGIFCSKKLSTVDVDMSETPLPTVEAGYPQGILYFV